MCDYVLIILFTILLIGISGLSFVKKMKTKIENIKINSVKLVFVRIHVAKETFATFMISLVTQSVFLLGLLLLYCNWWFIEFSFYYLFHQHLLTLKMS